MTNSNNPYTQSSQDDVFGLKAPENDDFDGTFQCRSTVTLLGSDSSFEGDAKRLEPLQQLPIPDAAGKPSGWALSFDFQQQMYQVHMLDDSAPPLFYESSFRSGTSLASGAFVPENSRVWLHGEPLPTPVSIPAHNLRLLRDPFLALSAPIVNLDRAFSSMVPAGSVASSRMSTGAIAGRTLYGEFAAVTDRGEARSQNQDAYVVQNCSAIRRWDGTREPGTYLVGIDGMGGYDGGRYFSDQLARVIEYEAPRGGSLAGMTQKALRFIATEVQESRGHALLEELPNEMGACYLGMTVLRNYARIEYQGDVRLMIIRNQGFVPGTPTIDHNVPGLSERMGELGEIDAFSHPARNTVYDSLKIEEGKAVEYEDLKDRCIKVQEALQLDPQQYSEHIIRVLGNFHSWIGNQERSRKVLLHRAPSLQEEWQDLESLLNSVAEHGQLTQDALWRTSVFVQKLRAYEEHGVELYSVAETIDWFPLEQGDVAILVSDGLTDLLFNSEILYEVKQLQTPEEIVRHLRELVHDVLTKQSYTSSDQALRATYGEIPRKKDDNVLILAYKHYIPFG